jgi:hypothetical protein
MKGSFVIMETLTIFGSLRGEIDTIGSWERHWQWIDSLRGLNVIFPKTFNYQNF